MKVLIIETTPATPHAETALEIAVKENISGSKVVYCPIFHLLPQLIWKSNINGRNSTGKVDSIADWLTYLTRMVSPYAEVDLFSLESTPDYLNESIRQNIFNFSYDFQPFGTLVKSNAIEIFRTVDLNFILDNHRNICESLAQTAIIAYELSLLLIRKHQPNLVYLFNGRTAASFPIFLACQKLGIKTLVHERGYSIDTYSLWETPPQYIDVVRSGMNKFSMGRSSYEARMSAAIFYYRQRNGKINNLGIINSQDHNLEIRIQGCHERFAVYFPTSSYELLCMPGQDCSNALGPQDVAIATLIRVCNEENMQLIIKMHPNTPKSEQAAYDKFADGEKCIVIPPESSISSYNLGASAFRNFSYGSTITWEFLYSGIQCAVLAYTVGRDEEGVIELSNAESIRQYLRNPLPPADPSFSIKYADFINSFGERYDFYRAETLFSGVFDVTLSPAK